MGSSKTLLVSATMLIVGVYAISLKSVQTTGMQTAQSQVNRVQIERVVDAALTLALDDTKSSFDSYVLKHSGDTKQVNNRPVLGGTVDYTIIRASSSSHSPAEIDLWVHVGGKTKVVVAKVEQARRNYGYRRVHRSDWSVASVFVKKG